MSTIIFIFPQKAFKIKTNPDFTTVDETENRKGKLSFYLHNFIIIILLTYFYIKYYYFLNLLYILYFS